MMPLRELKKELIKPKIVIREVIRRLLVVNRKLLKFMR